MTPASAPITHERALADLRIMREIKRPGAAARAMMAQLYVRYSRLRDNNPRPARRRRRKNEGSNP